MLFTELVSNLYHDQKHKRLSDNYRPKWQTFTELWNLCLYNRKALVSDQFLKSQLDCEQCKNISILHKDIH